MGRLLRKKPAVKKKPEQQEQVNSTDASAEKSETPASKAALFADSELEVKRPAAPSKKLSFGAKTTAASQEKNILDKSLQFLREVKVELKKVTWPTRKQAVGSTVVVIVVVMIVSLFLGVVDMGLSSMIRAVLP
ncbi:MAG: preprotein translocase subunit SecE [Desulfobacteraceae bacterium]|jgi:preprotein translocase subunit SecE|nr:preprotein translocase subunit SecE [Desulfobacteraceae bacterium]